MCGAVGTGAESLGLVAQIYLGGGGSGKAVVLGSDLTKDPAGGESSPVRMSRRWGIEPSKSSIQLR